MSRYDVVVIGAGPVGLATAMLVAAEGREVLVLEKDPAPAPATVAEAWQSWSRHGVSQFRQTHIMLPRFRQVLDAELPLVRARLEELGARRFSFAEALPANFRAGAAPEALAQFETITARRPVLECAFAQVAEDTPGVKVVRGTAAQGPLVGPSDDGGIPHVAGVRTIDGEEITADLVVDAMGRRSKLTEWVTTIGGRAPVEEASDAGFAYYTRFYRARDGVVPELLGPFGTVVGSVNVLTAWADNETWTLAITGLAGDRPLKALRDNAVWERVARAIPHMAHWLEGEPITDVTPMAGVMDRYRRLVVAGRPVVTGLVAVGDAWACTNPTAGRGLSMGLVHATLLRDALRAADDPAELATIFDQSTEEQLTPWYRQQIERDRRRAADIETMIDGSVPEAPPPGTPPARQEAFQAAAATDPEVALGSMEVFGCLTLPHEVLARPGVAAKVDACTGQRPPVMPGPGRDNLLALVQQ
jgi:2-polyprenyl-6-methoxyphenol hydroxylase-like FAD-dependent oxidoreductase